MRVVLLAIGVGAAFLVLIPPLLDEGEVVVLVTRADGRDHETPLWIVEVDGQPYLRASRPDSEWLKRVRRDPNVGLRPEEGGPRADVRHFRAELVEDAAIRKRVNKAMAIKYGFADKIWTRVSHRSASIPIRLIEDDPSADTIRRTP